MWEVENGEMMFSLDQRFSHVLSVVFDPSGNKIAVGSSDCNVYILNSWTDELFYTLEGHEVSIFIMVGQRSVSFWVTLFLYFLVLL